MRQAEKWKPTKFVFRNGKLIASRRREDVGVASRLMVDLVAKHYQAHLPKNVRGHLLDLGCGHVPLYELYRDYVEQTTCVDWGQTKHPSPHLDLECDLTRPLPFDDGTFQSVLLSDVLEHIPNPQSLCDEISRVLVDEGTLLLNVPFFYWLHERPHDYHRYTEFAIRRMMEQSGMTVVTLTAIGGSPEVVADLVAKHLQSVPVCGSLLASFTLWLTQMFVSIPPGRSISARTRDVWPLGYFAIARKNASNKNIEPTT